MAGNSQMCRRKTVCLGWNRTCWPSVQEALVKSCEYCGRDNDDAAVYCARCGANDWKKLTAPNPFPSKPAVQPSAAPSDVAFSKTRSITTIRCRTSGEAALVAD